VIHDHLLSENSGSSGWEGVVPPPIPIHSKPRLSESRETVRAQPSKPIAEMPKEGAEPWDPNRFYTIGSIVSHGSKTYRCINAHQGQIDWSPDAAVSLWQVV